MNADTKLNKPVEKIIIESRPKKYRGLLRKVLKTLARIRSAINLKVLFIPYLDSPNCLARWLTGISIIRAPEFLK